MKAGARV